MSATPLVSICCTAYNHGALIAQAIEGFLVQRADFSVEILIHDDASTDRAAAIIHTTCEARVAGRIRPIYPVANLYLQGNRPSHFLFRQARRRYIALCEGDDCWTDPLKLARQVEALERRPDVDLCFHPAIRESYGGRKPDKLIGRYASTDALIRVEDVIVKAHGMIPTASCMLRRWAVDEVVRFRTDWCGLRVGDVVIQTIASLHGGAFFIDTPMSVYRHGLAGSWTTLQGADGDRKLRYARDRIAVFDALDRFSGGRYGHFFRAASLKRILELAAPSSLTLALKRLFYREVRERLDLGGRRHYFGAVCRAALSRRWG